MRYSNVNFVTITFFAMKSEMEDEKEKRRKEKNAARQERWRLRQFVEKGNITNVTVPGQIFRAIKENRVHILEEPLKVGERVLVLDEDDQRAFALGRTIMDSDGVQASLARRLFIPK